MTLAALLLTTTAPDFAGALERATFEGVPKPGLTAAMAAKGIRGVSVAVIEDDRIVWAAGFGLRRDGGPKVDDATVFQAASISKPVFSLGLLTLVDEGKLDLDEDVNRKLRSWKLPASPFSATEAVTLRRLLSHTGGTTVHGFPGYEAGLPIPSLPQILSGTAPANTGAVVVEAVPGSKWNYSGGGLTIAQLLMEDVTGRPMAETLRDRVLKPLRMNRSSYDQPISNSLANDFALPYREDGQPVKGGPHTYPERAAAGLWTTPSDLCRFLIGLGANVRGEGGVLKAAMAREMTKNQCPPGGTTFGLGIGVSGTGQKLSVAHSGANEGYRCDMFYMPYARKGAVIMTNSDKGAELFGTFFKTIAGAFRTPLPSGGEGQG